MTGIQRLKRCPKVCYVDDERSIGNGITITLNEGWKWEMDTETSVRGFDTIKEAREELACVVYVSGA